LAVIHREYALERVSLIPNCQVVLIEEKWPELKLVAIQDFLTLLGIYTGPGYK